MIVELALHPALQPTGNQCRPDSTTSRCHHNASVAVNTADKQPCRAALLNRQERPIPRPYKTCSERGVLVDRWCRLAKQIGPLVSMPPVMLEQAWPPPIRALLVQQLRSQILIGHGVKKPLGRLTSLSWIVHSA